MVFHDTFFFPWPWTETEVSNGVEVCTNSRTKVDWAGIKSTHLDCAKNGKGDFSYLRNYSGCPAGWKSFDSRGSDCRPPLSYQGPCKSISVNSLAGVEELKKIESRCMTFYPRRHKPKSLPPFEQDFSLPCPAHWTAVDLGTRNGTQNQICIADITYDGNCPHIQNFTNLKEEEKRQVAQLCGLAFPAKPMRTDLNYNPPCPVGAPYNPADSTCEHPPGYIATKACPAKFPALPVSAKPDVFQEPMTPLEHTKGVNKSTLRKMMHSRECGYSWPEYVATRESKEPFFIWFHSQSPNAKPNPFICPHGYEKVDTYNIPLCRELPGAGSSCAPLFQAPPASEIRKFVKQFQGCFGKTDEDAQSVPTTVQWTAKNGDIKEIAPLATGGGTRKTNLPSRFMEPAML